MTFLLRSRTFFYRSRIGDADRCEIKNRLTRNPNSNRPIALRFSYHFTYLSRTFVTRHDPLSTKTSNPVPFRPFFQLGAPHIPVTFTRLPRRAPASGIAEAHEQVTKCISDRIAVRVAPSTSDARRRIVKCVRRVEEFSTTVAAFSHA